MLDLTTCNGSTYFTCCTNRLEVYCGKKQHTEKETTELDDHSGASAVLRNLKAILPNVTSDWHLIVTDRFYTSVQLALQLLHRNVYTVGTIMTNRLGYSKEIVKTREIPARDRPRGSLRVAFCREHPLMQACSWMDSKPVYFLSTGGSRRYNEVERRIRGGEKLKVPCPQMVVDYQRYMGGVDIHDQLRLQRYSVQMAFVFKKYYKSIFLGFLDIALVNAYIVWKIYAKQQGLPTPPHDVFLESLQKQLLAITEEDLQDMNDGFFSPRPNSAVVPQTAMPGHRMEECPDMYQCPDGKRKRRQRACKVCSLLQRDHLTRKTTKYFCTACSEDDKRYCELSLAMKVSYLCFHRLYLCNVARHNQYGDATTCFQIWHQHWNCGATLPAIVKSKKIQMRKPGKKRSQRQIFEEDE
jgi:hypothetical protein